MKVNWVSVGSKRLIRAEGRGDQSAQSQTEYARFVKPAPLRSSSPPPKCSGDGMSKLVVWILAASLSGGVSVLPAQAVNSIVFGANSGSCGRTVLCSSDGTHGYLTNGKGQAFKASTISKWLQIDADGKSHLKGQGVEPLRSAGAFVAMNDTGRPITKFALRIATDKKTCAGAMAAPCNAFSAKGGTGSFHYEAMLTARDRHNCTQGKTMRDICMGDPVSASFASNKVLY